MVLYYDTTVQMRTSRCDSGEDDEDVDMDIDGVALDDEDWSDDFTDDDKKVASNDIHDSDYAFRVFVQKLKLKFD